MSSNGHFTTRRGFVGTMGFGALGLYATWAAYGASPTPFSSGTAPADPHAGHGAPAGHGGHQEPAGHAGHEEPAIAEGHAPTRMTPDEFRMRHAEFVATNTQPDGSVRPTADAHDHAGHDHGSDDHGAHDHAAPPAAPPPAPTAATQPTTPPAGAMPHDMSTHMQMMRDMHAGPGTAMPNGMGGAMPPMANMQDMHAAHSMPGHDMSNMPDMMRTMHGDHAMPTPPAPTPAPQAAPAPQAPPPAASGHEGHTMHAAPPAPAPQPTQPTASGHEGHAMHVPAASTPAPAAPVAPAASTTPPAAPVTPATAALAHDHADGPVEVFLSAGRFAFEPADLRLETGRTYRFHMMSTDVAHGASIAFGKASRIVRLRPDTVTTLDLTFREAGRHLVYCTVYCGPGHDGMRASITVG